MSNLTYGTIYFLDASALVKLVLLEEGSGVLKSFVERAGPFYTTSLCFGEALGVIKSRRFRRHPEIDQAAYIRATHYLRSQLVSGIFKIQEADLIDNAVFFQAADLSDKYGIDLSDALQILTVARSHTVGATLITADEGLARAARAEGHTVWDCQRESPPAVA